jgi:DNA adenine methylase
MEPFLRWAGGKIWLRQHIQSVAPKSFVKYHEPFLGGGAIFFALDQNNDCFLSDLNQDLIQTYIQVRDDVDNVIKYLKKYKNNEEEYYKIRGSRVYSPSKKAAQFIYLNKTSFNGIYRVNRQGQYNVPYGQRTTIDYIQEDNLRLTSRKLHNSRIACVDFEDAITKVRKGDFVFLDPPYTVAHSNNNFIGYNQNLFSLDDQYRLANVLRLLNRIGAKFLLTNAYHKKIREIYVGTGKFSIFRRMSLIGGKGAARQNINEYVIRNY